MHCAQVAGVADLKAERARCTLLSGAVAVPVRSASHSCKRAVCESESAGAKARTCQMGWGDAWRAEGVCSGAEGASGAIGGCLDKGQC
eukprot:13394446-Ditylum_brightwellii.AAC.1